MALKIDAVPSCCGGGQSVGVKIAAVHNVGAIASGIVRAGADYVYLDGFKGGTGAAPAIIRDHVGIPLEIAIAVVDQRLRDEGIRNQASIIAAGSIRSSADGTHVVLAMLLVPEGMQGSLKLDQNTWSTEIELDGQRHRFAAADWAQASPSAGSGR